MVLELPSGTLEAPPCLPVAPFTLHSKVRGPGDGAPEEHKLVSPGALVYLPWYRHYFPARVWLVHVWPHSWSPTLSTPNAFRVLFANPCDDHEAIPTSSALSIPHTTRGTFASGFRLVPPILSPVLQSPVICHAISTSRRNPELPKFTTTLHIAYYEQLTRMPPTASTRAHIFLGYRSTTDSYKQALQTEARRRSRIIDAHPSPPAAANVVVSVAHLKRQARLRIRVFSLEGTCIPCRCWQL